MSEIVEGFDSRWWSGFMPGGYDYRFGYMKATEGSFKSREFPIQFDALRELGLAEGVYTYHRQAMDPRVAAREFYNYVKATGGLGILPQCLDFEDTRAKPSLQLFRHMKAFAEEVEDLFQRESIIYTATWWWNRWVKPYVRVDEWNPYALKLWEADPPPDTAYPGEWTSHVIRQIKLDWSAPGFNAKIDVDEADKEWFDEQVGIVVPPPPPTGMIELIVPAGMGSSVTVTEREI